MNQFLKAEIVRALTVGVALTAMVHAAAQAQEVARAIENDILDASSPGLGDIVVTAQKRAENVQDTPIAITAIGSDRIAQSSLDRPDKLGFSVPSMTNAESSGFSFLTLRGVGNSTAGLSEATVATYQDGVYTGMQIAQRVPTFDLERIEILRGPQGTLYGRNTTGGVVNYITKAPSFDAGATGDISYGNFDAVGLNIGLTGPIVEDKIAAKASFHYSTHDGYYPNVTIGGRDYAERQIGGRLAVLFRPTENLSVTVRGDVTKNKSTASYVSFGTTSLDDGLTSLATPLGIFSQPAAYFEENPGILSPSDIALLNGGSIADYYQLMQPGALAPDPLATGLTANRLANFYKTKTSGASITADWDLGDVNVKSISAYRYGDLNTESDISGLPVAINPIPRPFAVTQKQYTQEFNISGRSFNDKLDWLVGTFYYRDNGVFRGQYYLDGLGQFIQAGAFTASTVPEYLLALNYPKGSLPSLNSLTDRNSIWQTALSDGSVYPGDPVGDVIAGKTIPQTPFQGFHQVQRSQSYAAFAQLTYRVTDRLRLTGGIRYTIDKKDVHRKIHSNFQWAMSAAAMPADASDDAIAEVAGLCDTRSKKTWKKPTGSIGVDFDLGERVLTYAKVATGYKAGGMNHSECTNVYNPETLTDYEGGVKAVFADGQMMTNLAFYYYDYKNIQFLTFSDVVTLIKNAGSAKTYGVELEYAFRPNFAPGLQFDGSASYQKSRYGKGCFADAANTNNAGFLSTPQQACPAMVLNPNIEEMVPIGASANIKGNDMIRAPRWKFNTGVQYSTDVRDFGNVMARFDAAWTDKFYNTIFEDKAPGYEHTVQQSYWNLRAVLAWTSPDKRLGVDFFGDNLTNKRYGVDRQLVNLPPTLVNVSGLLGAPRTYGIRLKAKLGSAY